LLTIGGSVAGHLATGHWGRLAWHLVTVFFFCLTVLFFSFFFRFPLATVHLAIWHWGPGSVAGHLATDHWGWLALPLVTGRWPLTTG